MTVYTRFKALLFTFAFRFTHLLFGEDLCHLDHATVSYYAVRTDTGEVLFDKNSDLSLLPASCMKVVTTAAALHLLGEETRFETHLEYDGVITPEKTLRGNLYIRGGGDPCLGSDRIAENLSWEKLLDTWVEAIQKLGIRKIEGQVIGDATKWESALAVPSWTWEDLGNYYGAGACALSFHENYYSLTFQPGKNLGEAATILRIDPPIPDLVVKNEVKTGPVGSGDCACVYGTEYCPVQVVRGTIPAGVDTFTIKGAIPDPAACSAALLAKQLQRCGISIEGQIVAPVGQRVVFHTTLSPTVREIVYWTNQKSINLYAEHLLKKMGEGSTLPGIKAVTNFWKSQKIDLDGFKMVDGSGLSRSNLVTTKQFVSMLLKMKKSPFFPVFFDSLPLEPGEVRAKSGSMSLVRGYVGYKGPIAFAVLVDHCVDSQLMKEKLHQFLLKL